ncbi:MAG: hypothetical protein ABSE92_17625, partial [Terriglobales bacterium]
VVLNAYRLHDSERALELALRINMPGLWLAQVALTVIYTQLEQMDQAGTALRNLLDLRPDFRAIARQELSKWWEPEMVEQMLGDLRKAGLDVTGRADQAPTSTFTTPARSTSGETRATVREGEGFWVGVLPFKYAGSNEDLKALADGLTEDITTGLSRFSYIKVIARSTADRHGSGPVDVRSAGKELGARFVMEGSLRQSGNKLRLAVQLVDTMRGSHVWAETYERSFNPEALFDLQDELVPRIVSTVADAHGILPHTLGESVRSKSPEQLSPYEAVLRGFSYAERISPEEHAITRDALERAVQLAPTYAYAWAMLSLIIKDEFEFGFNPKPDPLDRMLQAARRAVELDFSGHRGFQALAVAHFNRKEVQAFRTAADRAIALNPMDGCNLAHIGALIAYAGEWERGCNIVERALQLNPNHPGWFWFPLAFNAYRRGDYTGALTYGLKINLPNFLWTHLVQAAIYGQLGQHEEAAKAVQELRRLNPHIEQVVKAGSQRLFDPELTRQLLDGLRKAGLEIPDSQEIASEKITG